MSEKITLEQFEVEFAPIRKEAREINRRLGVLHDAFVGLANRIELDRDSDDEPLNEDEFRDAMFDAASNFIDGIDYEYSEVDEGNVQIWQASTC